MENKQDKSVLKTKLWMMLLSVLIAIGLWLYVVTVVSPESEKTIYNIPVGLQSESLLEERGLMVTSEDIPTVNLRLKGSRTDLDKLTNANITVVADVSRVGEAGEPNLNYDISFPGDVPNNAISTQKRTPDRVSITVEERISKTVTVQVKVDKESLEGDFKVDTENAQLANKEIQIVGPKRIVDQVEKAVIFVDVAGKTESISNEKLPYTLVDKDDKPVDDTLVEDTLETPGVVTLDRLTIGLVKEVVLDLEILYGGGATAENTDVDLSVERIMVFGSQKRLEALGDTLTIGKLDLGQIPENTQQKIELQMPEGITCESGETEVTVDVSFRDLATKTLSVTEFSLTNQPAGMSAQVITKILEVTVRGPQAQIDKITAEDIRVAADMKDYPEGTQTLPVVITTGTGFGQVGAVGTYTVSAILRKR